MTLNANDARELADRFLESASVIDDYLDKNWKTIDRPDYEMLSESAKTLLRVSGFMTTVAVGLSIDQMEDDATDLKQVIVDAKQALEDLKVVGDIIRVAAGLVGLATAIMAKDAGDIFKAFKGLYELTSENDG